jgi:ribosomal protein L20
MIDWHIKARALRESGAKTKDIAAALGKGHSAVRQALSAYCGTKVKCPVDHIRTTDRKNRKAEFTTLWLAGVPTRQIARRFNLAYGANVSALAARFKLPPRMEHRLVWTPELDNELRALWSKRRRRKGHRKAFLVRDIAKHFNTTRHSVNGAARRLGLPRQLQSCVRWTADQNRELRKLWLDNEISVQQIALRLGHTKKGVIARRPLLGLPPRRLRAARP